MVYSNDKIVKCNVLRGLRKTSSRIKTLRSRKGDFSFLTEGLREMQWETDFLGGQKSSGVLEDCQRWPESLRGVHTLNQKKEQP